MPALHRLRGVDDHIGDDLRQLVAVAGDFRQIGFEIEDDLNICHPDLIAEQFERAVNDAVEIDGLAFRRLAPRQRKEAFDDARAAIRCLKYFFRARHNFAVPASLPSAASIGRQ